MIPIVNAKKLWHWGDLDESSKGERGSSWEGNLLSTSPCPSAWMQICRLGGSQLHVTTSSLKLLDMYSLLQPEDKHAKATRRLIDQWAIDAELLETTTVYRISRFDDELDQMIYMEFSKRDEAELEIDGAEEDSSIEQHEILAGTDKLLIPHGLKGQFQMGVEMAIIEWARLNCPDIAGVHWDDNLAPHQLSAPRSGLFKYEKDMFKPTDKCPHDEMAMHSIGAVVWLKNGRRPEPDLKDASPSL